MFYFTVSPLFTEDLPDGRGTGAVAGSLATRDRL